MKTTQWDRVFSASPLTKEAALGSTNSYDKRELPRNPDASEWDAPPPFRSPNKVEMAQSNFLDLTGTKKGRLMVMGILKNNETQSQKWLCRCACGKFVVRKAKAIKNPNNDQDACVECQHMQQVRRFDSPEQRAQRKAMGLGF